MNLFVVVVLMFNFGLREREKDKYWKIKIYEEENKGEDFVLKICRMSVSIMEGIIFSIWEHIWSIMYI